MYFLFFFVFYCTYVSTYVRGHLKIVIATVEMNNVRTWSLVLLCNLCHERQFENHFAVTLVSIHLLLKTHRTKTILDTKIRSVIKDEQIWVYGIRGAAKKLKKLNLLIYDNQIIQSINNIQLNECWNKFNLHLQVIWFQMKILLTQIKWVQKALGTPYKETMTRWNKQSIVQVSFHARSTHNTVFSSQRMDQHQGKEQTIYFQTD